MQSVVKYQREMSTEDARLFMRDNVAKVVSYEYALHATCRVEGLE